MRRRRGHPIAKTQHLRGKLLELLRDVAEKAAFRSASVTQKSCRETQLRPFPFYLSRKS